MERRQVVELVLQFLNENGYYKTQGMLQEESGVVLETDRVHVGGLLHTILNKYGESDKGGDRQTPTDITDLLKKPTVQAPSSLARTVEDLHTGPILTAKLSDDMLLVTGSVDKTVAVTKFADLDTFSSYRENTLEHHTGAILAVDFHPIMSNIVLTSSMDKTHHIVDCIEGQVHQSFADHEKYVVRVKWSPNGKWFATASYDRSVCLYREKDSTDDGSLQFEKVKVFYFSAAAESIVFSPESDELCISVREDYLLHFVDLNSPDFERTNHINMNALKDTHVSFSALDVSYSPFGKKYILVCTDKNRLIVYSRESGEQVRNFYGATNDEWSTPRHCWHPSGQYIFATSQDRCIYIWEVASQKIVGKLAGHEGNIRDVSFNEKLNVLVSCGFDKTVRFWK